MDYSTSENFYIDGLGIDQGYANCGVAVVRFYPNKEKDNIEILHLETIKTSSTKNMNKRLEKIYNSIINIMNIYSIKIMGCEKLFVNVPMKQGTLARRNKSANIVNTSFVTGILFLISAMYNIDIYEFAPTSVKKKVTNNGRASKEELYKVIEDIALSKDIQIKTDHESDAIGICISSIKQMLEDNKQAN